MNKETFLKERKEESWITLRKKSWQAKVWVNTEIFPFPIASSEKCLQTEQLQKSSSVNYTEEIFYSNTV